MRRDRALVLAQNYHAIRTSVADEGAILHASGQALFADDLPDIAGTLHLAVGMSKVARGRISRFDLATIEAMPDVVLALTARDIPGANDASPHRTEDHPILSGQEISHEGQVLFAVAARTYHAAIAAVEAAPVVVTPTLPTADLDDALATHATLLPDYGLERGTPTDAIKNCDRRIIGQIRAAAQDHAALEPIAALAVPGEGGALHLIVSTESPALVHRIVTEMLELPANAVTVEARRIGAAFGGRRAQSCQWAALAALAAWRSGRPCKLRLPNRAASLATGNRQDMRIDYSAGFNADGSLIAVEAVFATRCGSGVDYAAEANDRILLSADSAYYYPSFRLVSRRMRTNTPPGAWWRSVGIAEGTLFSERLMEHIAVATGRDALDVRKANLYGPERDLTPFGTTVENGLIARLVGDLERSSEYRRRRGEIAEFNRTSPLLKKGLALTAVKAGVGLPSAIGNDGACFLQLARDGSVLASLSHVEGGQGVATKAAQIIAEEFGVGLGAIRIQTTSTRVTGNTGGASADPTLMAVIAACQNLKDHLYDFIESTMEVEREQVEFADRHVRLGPRRFPLPQLLAAAADAQIPLQGTGNASTPSVDWDRASASGNPFHYFVYGAACTELTVDIMTGERRLDRVDILQDAGRSLNPAIDVGLVEGGFALGLGWLTSEELNRDSTGRIGSLGADYVLPRAGDIPSDFRVAFFQSAGARDGTPYRSKDIEEATMPLAVSVYCAITDAIRSLKPTTLPRLAVPATPEATMRAIRGLAGND